MSNMKRDERWMGMIGERVVIEGLGDGSLEYYGRVRKSHNDHGKVMCGVMLDDRVGLNDGTVGIWRYFTCEPDHGIFVSVDKVTLEAEYNTPKERVRRALRAKEVEKQKQRTNLNSPRSGRKAKRAPKTEDVAAARLAEENRKLKAMLSAAKAASPRVSKKKRSASRGSNRSPDGGGSVKRIPQTHNARAQHSYASMILSKSGRSSKSPLGRGRAEDDDEGGDDFGNDDDDNEAQEVDADADGDVEHVDEDPDLDEELGNSENAEGGGDAAAADGEGQADADASTAAADAAAAALGVDTISKMVQEQLAAEISKMVSLQTDEKAIVEAEKVKLSEALRSAGETHAAEVKGLETR